MNTPINAEVDRVARLGAPRASLRELMKSYIQHLAGVTDYAWSLAQAKPVLEREETAIAEAIQALPPIDQEVK